MKTSATARAHANIALVKYWGKRDAALNLPAAGSLSLTLDGLSSTTTVTFDPAAPADELLLDGAPADPAALRKALRVIDAVRARAGLSARARVASVNDFPTGAGLASSSSGLAALALAAARAAGLDLAPAELSALARLGSGSACRSIFGGFVEWRAGVAPDGNDCHGVPLFSPEHWDLRVVVAVISAARKAIDSTRGMLATEASSPYQPAFVASVPQDLAAARRAVADRDLELLARVAERSCLRLHAAMIAADPPLLYLQPASWRVIALARELRRDGAPLFFTADAGPNVKLFCEPSAQSLVTAALHALPEVQRVIIARPGGDARVLDP